jgi:hypothetical protein
MELRVEETQLLAATEVFLIEKVLGNVCAEGIVIVILSSVAAVTCP